MSQNVSHRRPRGDALDLLEYENRAIIEILHRFENTDEKLRHGLAGKLLVEHLAVREAAREAVAQALLAEPDLADLGAALEEGIGDRRRALDRLDELARGVQPVNLNQGQDFDGEVASIKGGLRAEIDQDVALRLPRLRERVEGARRKRLLPSAMFIRHHAPTHLHPEGRRWYERLWPLVRLHALYDWLRGFPMGGTLPSEEIELPAHDDKPF